MSSLINCLFQEQLLPERARGGVAGPAHGSPALACSHGQGGKAELFSLSSKETKKTPKCLVSVLEKQGLWPHRKEREQWSFAVTSVFFFF